MAVGKNSINRVEKSIETAVTTKTKVRKTPTKIADTVNTESEKSDNLVEADISSAAIENTCLENIASEQNMFLLGQDLPEYLL